MRLKVGVGSKLGSKVELKVGPKERSKEGSKIVLKVG